MRSVTGEWTPKKNGREKKAERREEKRSKRGREEERKIGISTKTSLSRSTPGKEGRGRRESESGDYVGIRWQMADGRWQRQPEETRNDSEKYFILSSTKLVVCGCGCGCHWQPECADFFFFFDFFGVCVCVCVCNGCGLEGGEVC